MHCIACDCFLTESELMMVKDDGSSEDMCYDCRSVAYNSEMIDLHDYQHQHLTEMIDNYFYNKKLKEDNDNS